MHKHFAVAAGALALAAAHPAAAQGGGFGTAGTVPFALQGRVYYIPDSSDGLPDFSRLRPVGTISTTVLNIQPQSFTVGFPGVTDRFEWFALDYSGRIMLPQAGTYTFRLTSDDGSKLFIDGREVIDNDGVHRVDWKD
ncbi:MAG TPA: PA14 domain-containing protein, partial [Longimicrobium sp.]|nr:PA14 domain-containing protein [Longimicrobium sp.]